MPLSVDLGCGSGLLRWLAAAGIGSSSSTRMISGVSVNLGCGSGLLRWLVAAGIGSSSSTRIIPGDSHSSGNDDAGELGGEDEDEDDRSSYEPQGLMADEDSNEGPRFCPSDTGDGG